jgi:hypothetical protein
MKKILLVLVLVVVGVYAQGAILFSESGANRFLSELEDLSLQGDSEAFCNRLHEDMEVSIDDTSADPPAQIEGGKQELCDYVSEAAKGLGLLGVSTNLMRDDFTVRRSWLHPWTAEVSYFETRTTHMSRVNVTLNTTSEDQWTLVNTFSGIKVKRLTSTVRLAESP